MAALYARMTTFAVKPEHATTEGYAAMRANLKAKLAKIPGLVRAYCGGERTDRRCFVLALYDSAEAAEVAADRAAALWFETTDFMDDDVEPEFEEWPTYAVRNDDLDDLADA